ncbi:MAG: hypothetical protein JWP91_560 [Fibrobacteres bacterium]|nr:hypothetical protein [Fibrobacterota bacterium]
MRELRYFLELSDAAHRDEAPISFVVAESLLRGMDWKLSPIPPTGEDGEPSAPFMLFLDEGESFFMIMPEQEGVRVTARVLDKWNLLGLVSKDKTFTLNFGLVGLDDALVLLKLFYEDNYPALRSLEKGMKGP